MTSAALIDMAVARMDELQPFDSTLIVSGGNALLKPARDYASECIGEAIHDVLKVCNPRCIVSITTAAISGGTLTLPSNVLRILHLINGTKTIDINVEGSEVHRQQSHAYSAATTAKPAAILFNTNTLQLYPTGMTGWSMKYVAKVDSTAAGWNSDTYFTVDLLPAIAWQCAGKALAVMGDQRAATAFEIAKAQLK